MKDKVVIINNEKCTIKENEIFCDNIEMKSLPESLSSYFDIQLVLRKGRISGTHKINVNNISTSSNIVSFIFQILKHFDNKKKKFLIISITPYTFIAFLFLVLGNKKIFLYLRSNGLDEYRLILGKKFVWIYRLMLFLMCKRATIFCVNDRILNNKKKYKLVSPSQLDKQWLENNKPVDLDEIKLLYVGRIKIEKGIFSLLNLLKAINLNRKYSLSIIGNGKKINNSASNIHLLNPISRTKDLIKVYDDNNITILPSFTEGHPQVLIESLARKRPVIVFNEIDFVKRNYKGVFISKRETNSLADTINYVIKNYKSILQSMEENNLPSKEMFVNELKDYLVS